MKKIIIASVLFFIPSLLAFVGGISSPSGRSGGALFAQDFHLSQYDEASLNLNPALTGLYNGTFRIHLHHRTQWASITNNPYTTTLISGEQRLKKISVGGQISNERAGAGNYNVLGLQLSVAYDKTLGSKKTHHISTGVQAGFLYKSVNMSLLTFESQYTSANGGSIDNSIANGEPNVVQNAFLPDFNLGLLYYYAKNKSRINPFIGISAFHLNTPKESFFSENNRLPMRFLVHSGCKINIGEKVQLVPKFLYMQQANNREMVAGMDVNFYIPNTSTFFIIGSSYRNKDAVIGFVGLKYKRCTYKVSYDVNNSLLNSATAGRGAFEISFTLIGSRHKPTPIPNCPRPL